MVVAAICLCQNPNTMTSTCRIRGEDAEAVLDGKLVFLLIFLWHVSPIAVHMPAEKFCRGLLCLLSGAERPGVATTRPHAKPLSGPPVVDAGAGGTCEPADRLIVRSSSCAVALLPYPDRR
jgi:hypothetical protein